MSESSEPEEVEGLSWEKELEDDSLAEAQQKLENEFGIDFEELDHGLKGFSKENGFPFYTEVDDGVEFMGEEVHVSIERDGGLNSFSFWADDIQVMERLDEYLQDFTASNSGEAFIEPYRYRNVRDTEVVELLMDLNQHFQLDGPQRRPGKGQPRIYPIRRSHVPDEGLESMPQFIGESPEYVGEPGYVPGDARFELFLEEDEVPELDGEFNAELSVKPRKAIAGRYDVALDAETMAEQTYLIEKAAETIER